MTDLGEKLADEGYLESRISPRRRDVDYLCLKDVCALVGRIAPTVRGKVFDYGCGGAPYRELFSVCEAYIGADVTPGPRVDVILPSEGGTREAAGTYDFVLSSQVLEHVVDPTEYLRECHRILKPGGEVLVTTHGMFHEHGCPEDYHRWTPRGLENLVESVGFKVQSSYKLTIGIRAAAQLKHHVAEQMDCSERLFFDRCFRAARRVYRRVGIPLLNWAADRFPEQAVCDGSHGAPHYIGVAVRGGKR